MKIVINISMLICAITLSFIISVKTLAEASDVNNIIGNNDISNLGDGTITGAITKINNNFSHVGMIVQSTKLDTMEKVIAIYGGTTWVKIEGRFLLGQSTSYANNTTGGEASHKLTINEMPSHNHLLTSYWYYGTVGSHAPSLATVHGSGAYTQNSSSGSTGGNAAHNNMPPYKSVYIWERTA